MREERIVMGMPARVELVGECEQKHLDVIFALWEAIDERFSTYKDTSEIMRINRGEISPAQFSKEVQEVFSLAESTAAQTNGYFNIKRPDGFIDPSGLVKGWAIQQAAQLAQERGFNSYYLEIGGDIQTSGKNE